MKTNNCLVKLQPINAELRLPDLAKGMLLLNSTEQLENLKFFIFKKFKIHDEIDIVVKF